MNIFTGQIENPEDDQIMYQSTLNERKKYISQGGAWHLRAVEKLTFGESLLHGDCVTVEVIEIFDS